MRLHHEAGYIDAEDHLPITNLPLATHGRSIHRVTGGHKLACRKPSAIGWKAFRQRAPAAARARQLAGCVQDLAKIHSPTATNSCRIRQQRGDLRPFFIRQIGRIALRLPLDLGHTASRRWSPHHKLESRPSKLASLFKRTLSASQRKMHQLGASQLRLPG